MIDSPEEYFFLPIIPFVGAGSINLGDTRQDILRKIGKPLYLSFIQGIRGKVQIFHYDVLEIWLPQEKVSEIDVVRGYQGSTKEGLTPGASWKKLREAYPTVSWHEDECRWYVPGIDGLSFDIVRPPRDDEIPLSIPWEHERYVVIDPEHAFVFAIEVHDIRYT